MAKSSRIDDVIESLPAASPAAGENERRSVSGANDDVGRAAGAVEEVPRRQEPLLALDEQQALAGEHQEALLVPFAVIEAQRLSG